MDGTDNVASATYVVVGAGTAGCVVASRLSEDPSVRVVLVEAGPADGPEAMRKPSGWPALLGTEVDWAFSTTPQSGLGGAGVFYPRGRVLGGSSAINGSAHLRAHRDSYDRWVTQGALGWGYEDLLPYFRRSERAAHGDPRYRGTDGPMEVGVPLETAPFEAAVHKALTEAGHPVSDDLNGSRQEGVGWVELNVVDGVRQSAADAYVRPFLRARSNLTVLTGARVQRLSVTDGGCDGIVYERDGEEHHLRATREVVLSAGVIGSPHLLMLSGIGPAKHLRAHGIDVQVDLPAVGANLQDHPATMAVHAADRPVASTLENPRRLAAMLRSSPDLTAPDLQLLFWDFAFVSPGTQGPDPGFTVCACLMHPHSRGTVRLATADPVDAPLIDPAFLNDDRDVRELVRGLRRARALVGETSLGEWSGGEFLPGDEVEDDEALAGYVRSHLFSAYHPVGTCRMGTDTDPNAVVDTYLRARGVRGLRVVDASVMPSLVAANPNATVLALAERAADLIAR